MLSLRQTLLLHEYMILKHGGSSGIRDKSMLESAINRPFATFGGSDLYPDIYMKAAALIQSIVKNHPFIDGNKRTAFASMVVFLGLNGIELDAPPAEATAIILGMAASEVTEDELARWVAECIRPFAAPGIVP